MEARQPGRAQDGRLRHRRRPPMGVSAMVRGGAGGGVLSAETDQQLPKHARRRPPHGRESSPTGRQDLAYRAVTGGLRLLRRIAQPQSSIPVTDRPVVCRPVPVDAMGVQSVGAAKAWRGRAQTARPGTASSLTTSPTAASGRGDIRPRPPPPVPPCRDAPRSGGGRHARAVRAGWEGPIRGSTCSL